MPLFFVCFCAPRQKQRTSSRKKNDGVETVPLDVYGLENLTTVTKINLRAHYVCCSLCLIRGEAVGIKKQGSVLPPKHNTVSCSPDDQHWSYGPLCNGPRIIHFSYHNSHTSNLFVKRC